MDELKQPEIDETRYQEIVKDRKAREERLNPKAPTPLIPIRNLLPAHIPAEPYIQNASPAPYYTNEQLADLKLEEAERLISNWDTQHITLERLAIHRFKVTPEQLRGFGFNDRRRKLMEIAALERKAKQVSSSMRAVRECALCKRKMTPNEGRICGVCQWMGSM